MRLLQRFLLNDNPSILMSNLDSKTAKIGETKRKSYDLAVSNQHKYFDTDYLKANLIGHSIRVVGLIIMKMLIMLGILE